MEYVEFEKNTKTDPWYMRWKRAFLFLCIYKYHKGYWRIVNNDIVIKIAKIIYNIPLDFKNLIYLSHLNPALKFIRDGNSWTRLTANIKVQTCQCERPLFDISFMDNNYNRQHFYSCGINHLSGLDVFVRAIKKQNYNKPVYEKRTELQMLSCINGDI
jgi:hypothetical protein